MSYICMKLTFHPKSLVSIAIPIISCAFLLDSNGQPKTRDSNQEVNRDSMISIKFGSPIPLKVQSNPVEWKGNKFSLVKLGSLRFNLERDTGRLTAEAEAGVTTFDNVDYDI